MAKIKGMVVRVVTKNIPAAGTKDRLYVGVVGSGGGSEYPLTPGNFAAGQTVKLSFGDVWDTSALAGSTPATGGDGSNDPEYRVVDLDKIQYVYIRKSSKATGPADDEWRLDEVEVALYAAAPQKRTFFKMEDIWLANENGMQVWLKEREPYLYVSQTAANKILVIDTTSTMPSTVETITAVSQPGPLVLNHDKSRLYVAGSQGLSIIDTTKSPFTVTATVAVGASPASVAVDRYGKKAFVACGPSGDATIKVVDLTATPPRVTGSIPLVGTMVGNGSIATTPTGSLVFVAGGAKPEYISVFDTHATPTLITTINGDPFSAVFILCNPEGTRLFAGFERRGFVIDATASPPVVVGQFAANSPYGALSPDGTRMLVSSAEPPRTYFVYDATIVPPQGMTSFLPGEPAIHPPVGLMCYSQDGTKVYVLSDGIHVMDMTSQPPALIATMPIAGTADHLTT